MQLARDLWDSLEAAEIGTEVPLADEQRAELDRRFAELERDRSHWQKRAHGR